MCENIKCGYKECFSQFALDNKHKLVNNKKGKECVLWNKEDIKSVYDAVRNGIPNEDIFNMFPNRTKGAVYRFVLEARKKYGIKERKQYPTKKVDKFDLEGNYIETYNSVYEASAKNGILHYKIMGCCRGARDNADGFIWRYTRNEEGYYE